MKISLTKTTETKAKKPSAYSPKVSKGKRKMMMTSAAIGVVIMIVGYQISEVTGDTTIRDLSMVAGIMAAVLPLSMTQVRENRRKDSIDSNLPIFLLALISAVESGASLLRAVEDAANRQMGSLTPELKNLRANISWSMPHQEAFENFTRRVGTRLAKRVSTLLEIAMDIGGDVVGTLEMVQKHVTEMQNIEKERKAALTPYIYTIYISFAVFLAVTLLLVANFFTELEVVQNQLLQQAEESNIPLGMFESLIGIDVAELNSLMFNMSLVEALFGGLAAGKIGEGSFVAGIKHAIIMVVMAVIAFSMMGAI